MVLIFFCHPPPPFFFLFFFYFLIFYFILFWWWSGWGGVKEWSLDWGRLTAAMVNPEAFLVLKDGRKWW